ncbi:DNA recombination protein RmuC homolog [Sphingomonas sp. EC-HK361]|uniref:DNA recombination protein RmuC n=1 Tax=Sphingomonas sp. EC-HK361 TaxID=2038397 RepID=UPI001259523C|nr:DNA recombination protein RmuC [Sphingomonas sp. EC-HK361]VVT02796.1 DNA recombination protein RmuC homolog [Sphingomonas sp. EC-HK361]
MDGSMIEIVLVGILALAAGLAIGWLVASRLGQALASDLAVAQARAADAEIVRAARDAVERERNEAMQEVSRLRAQAEERQASHEATVRQLNEARDAMTAQFNAAAAKALESAQAQFLERADARFRQSEESAGQNLKSMLQPVSDRLQRYEQAVEKVESERKGAFSELKGQIEQMRLGQEKVSTEAAKLVNSLRNAPKSRGRWGEQQLKNVLEISGLSEHIDFETEVSVESEEGGRLRPDAVIRVPGGRNLIIDAKVSLNAYQDAFGAIDETERARGLDLHAAAMRAHVNALSNKAYWSQFADTPDYVIMFIPGEHLLSAALEYDPKLWEFAFDKKVLLATPTNLIAIARTVSAVWRQEKLAVEAQRIGQLGKELYERLAKAAGDLRKVGGGLTSAVNNYNAFVSSFESRALVTARKFRDLNIDTGAREIEDVAPVEALARYGQPLLSEAENKEGNN